MRTTFDIDEKLLESVRVAAKVKTKKAGIVVALKEYLRAKQRAKLRAMIGQAKDFGLNQKELEKLRE